MLRSCIITAALALILAACGGGDKFAGPRPGPGVNGYLWRATLDSLYFMPLVDLDPQTGSVITDWYSNPDAPDERVKVSAYILDNNLRADALDVKVVRQTRAAGGNWISQPVQAATELKIEDAILDRARELRIASLEG